MASSADMKGDELLADTSDVDSEQQWHGQGSRKRSALAPIPLLAGGCLVAAAMVILAGRQRGSPAPAATTCGSSSVVGLSEKHKCSSATENCMETMCCKNAGFTCFKKNDQWANCNDTCTKGINHMDPEAHRTPWSCEVLGGEACSGAADNCMDTKCCKDPGFTCYEKNSHWANCNDTCARGTSHLDPEDHRTPWTCKIVGPTAGYPGNPDPDHCSKHHSTYPTSTRCVADPDARGPYPPAKSLWSCDCDRGCDAPREEMCEQCGSHDGKTCFWALTWYCCDDSTFEYHW